jgi:hypothetical protein
MRCVAWRHVAIREPPGLPPPLRARRRISQSAASRKDEAHGDADPLARGRAADARGWPDANRDCGAARQEREDGQVAFRRRSDRRSEPRCRYVWRDDQAANEEMLRRSRCDRTNLHLYSQPEAHVPPCLAREHRRPRLHPRRRPQRKIPDHEARNRPRVLRGRLVDPGQGVETATGGGSDAGC